MITEYFQYKEATLAFRKSGRGGQPLLLFHGFGQDHQAFDVLLPVLEKNFTIFSFDLPFHGETKWKMDETPLESGFLSEMFYVFLQHQKIDRFNLLGFSLGAKFVLAMLELFPKRIKNIILIAPDGIKTNVWYSLATYPILLRKLFKKMISSPGYFERLAKLVATLKIADKGLVRFAQTQMNTEERRKRVYYTWVVMRHLKFNLRVLARHVELNQINLVIIVGRFDRIITAENVGTFIKMVPSAKLEIVDAGHSDLINKARPVISSAI